MKTAAQGSAFRSVLHRFSRAVLYGTLLEVLFALLYVVGNFQAFTDATQLSLVRALQYLSSVVVVAALLSVIAWIVDLIRSRTRRSAALLAGMFVTFMVSVSLVLGSTTILVMQQPY